MGAVYELLHPGIGKRLALKVLHAEYAKKEQIVQRFFAEARAVNQIGHPNIVDIINFDQLEDGSAFLMMEFLDGQSLASYMAERGPLGLAEVAEIVLPICDALQAAHNAGITHRDLKPDNVYLVSRPDNPRYVKLLDFGIAKLSTENVGPTTRTGQVMGTPTYMSPEQAMGRTREIDHRTDVYALGVLLYQMLTGDVPFRADSFGDLMLLHLQQPPPPLAHRRPDLPPVWNHIVQTALAKNRDDRFRSMHEMADAIRAGVGGSGIQRTPLAATHVGTPSGPYAAPGSVSGTGPYAGARPGPTSGTGPFSAPPSTGPGVSSQAPGMVPGTGPGSYPGTASVPGTGLGAVGSGAVSGTGSDPGLPHPHAWPGPASTPPATRRRPWLVVVVLGFLIAGAGIGGVVALSGGGASSARTSGTAAQATAQTEPDAAEVAMIDADIGIDAPAPVAADTSNPVVDAAVPAAAPDNPIAQTDEATGAHSGPTPHEPGTGEVRVSAQPWAKISINGTQYGMAPVNKEVRAGKVVVKAFNSELGVTETESFVLKPGEIRRLSFTLVKGAKKSK